MAELTFIIDGRRAAWVSADWAEHGDGEVSIICPNNEVRANSAASTWDSETTGVFDLLYDYLKDVAGMTADDVGTAMDDTLCEVLLGRNCLYELVVDTVKLTSTLTTRDSPGQALLRAYAESLPDGPAKDDALEIINR